MRSSEGTNKKQPISSPLRQERELRGWSRSYVAEQLEVDIMTVGRWERGERLPHPYHRQKLCDLFEKNALELGLLPEPLTTSNDNDQNIVFDSPLP
jgi:transcriptional regulator with XRE-family HTH domain